MTGYELSTGQLFSEGIFILFSPLDSNVGGTLEQRGSSLSGSNTSSLANVAALGVEAGLSASARTRGAELQLSALLFFCFGVIVINLSILKKKNS